MMRFEVVLGADYPGDVIGDINRHRGQVVDYGKKDASVSVQGLVPLAEMFGNISFRRSAANGRGLFTRGFDHCAETPGELVDKMIGKEFR
jgi:elongation factor G